MVNVLLVDPSAWACHCPAQGVKPAFSGFRSSRRRAGSAVLIGLALVTTGCVTKPKLPPGAHPRVEVEPPRKSDAWRSVATQADEDRLARLDPAWQQALTEAGKSFSAEIRKEGH